MANNVVTDGNGHGMPFKLSTEAPASVVLDANGYVPTTGGPGLASAAVTPSDSTDLALNGIYPRALYVGGAGDVVVKCVNDSTAVTFKAVPVGAILPISCKRVMAASTATFVVAIY